jgi:hypothetical protein
MTGGSAVAPLRLRDERAVEAGSKASVKHLDVVLSQSPYLCAEEGLEVEVAS